MDRAIKLINQPVYFKDNKFYTREELVSQGIDQKTIDTFFRKTISHSIFTQHNKASTTVKGGKLRLKFDALASHDITYVGIIQTARAIGIDKFPVPYVLTNCHNSLCAVGGTINQDDHVFGYSAVKKYGGIYVPANLAVIHTFMREMHAAPKKMILGSDSHTRYGAIGTMGIGEGGPEIVKQLISKTYDIDYPEVVAVHLKGQVPYGVGPHDVALAIIGETFKSGFVKNAVMEFIGDGIQSMDMEFRNGVDVMTTETTCLSSIWQTDLLTRDYLRVHNRVDEYKELKPKEYAGYDRAIEVDLSKIVPKIAMPFHPSNVYDLKDVIENPHDILHKTETEINERLKTVKVDLMSKIKAGRVKVDQGIIAGCAGGTYNNVYIASEILKDKNMGNFDLNVYPSSQPIYYDLIKKDAITKLIQAGAVIKPAFCGPCFGAGDIPANNEFSIRHTTRNFESREGSKLGEGQIAMVALMDSRSIAATAASGGYLTQATDVEFDNRISKFYFDETIYEGKVYNGFNAPQSLAELKFGPNIKDWPEQIPLTDNLVVKVVSSLKDPVTTTDELIPSGEISSFRSNPLRLAEFALSRKDPMYVERAKQMQKLEYDRRINGISQDIKDILKLANIKLKGTTSYGSSIFAIKPGDGSAREQAASSQRVLGGVCNIARDYATKRYRSNLINWGMIPFLNSDFDFEVGDLVVIEDIKKKIKKGNLLIKVKVIRDDLVFNTTLGLDELTKEEGKIILAGCLINYYKEEIKKK